MLTTINDDTANGFRRWWTAPPRPGLRRIISPVEYRHLRAWGRVRIASAILLTGFGTLTLTFGGRDRKTYGWAIWFLSSAAANAAFGSWELSLAGETDQHSGDTP